MSETRTVYDVGNLPFEKIGSRSERPAPTKLLYSTDSQIGNLLDILQYNEEPGIGVLSAGFLLLHKDLDRIATALEMRNRADTADRPLSRRLRAVSGGARP